MLQSYIEVRNHLTQVLTFVNHGKCLTSMQALHTALKEIENIGMTQKEQDDVNILIASCWVALKKQATVAGGLTSNFDFSPGSYVALLNELARLIGLLYESDDEGSNEGEPEEKAIEYKKLELAKGQKQLDAGEHDNARETFSNLIGKYHKDAELAVTVGDKFMNSGLYNDANTYYDQSLKIQPHAPHVYNRMGIVLRKKGEFESSEFSFKKALAIEDNDPHLYFNLGRLYLDWKKWAEAVENAEKAVELNAEFAEARQLATYAQKKLGKH